MKTLPSILLICMIAFSSAVNGQGNFKTGYIVDLKGDTLRGSINYKRWDKNPRTITFKQTGSVQELNYSALEIRGFYVADEVYTSATVDVDISPYKISDLSSTSTPEFVKHTVFLQKLIQGEKNLLYLKDQKSKIHFYFFDNGYKPLVYKQYIQSIFDPTLNGYKKGLYHNTEFKTQLAFYLKECPDIQDKMRMLKYEQSSLLKLYNAYYKCVNKEVQYSNSREETELKMGILVAATGTKFSFTDPTWSRLKGFSTPIHPSVGTFFDFRLLRTRGLTIANDLFFTSFKTKAEGYVPGSGSYDRALSSFTAQVLESNHQLRFDLFNNSGLFFSGGVSVAMCFEKFETTVLNPTETLASESQASGFLLRAVAGLGYGFRKFSTEIRIETPSQMRGYDITTAHLFLKYRLH